MKTVRYRIVHQDGGGTYRVERRGFFCWVAKMHSGSSNRPLEFDTLLNAKEAINLCIKRDAVARAPWRVVW